MKPRPRPKRRCVLCDRSFAINPRVGKRHRFCSRPACAKASRRAAQRQWLKKWQQEHGGESYFAGQKSLGNTPARPARHPDCKKRTRRSKGARCGRFRLTSKLAAVVRSVALQDTIDTVLALQIGLISRLTGAALQDTIARKMRALILRGNAILQGQRSKRTPFAGAARRARIQPESIPAPAASIKLLPNQNPESLATHSNYKIQ